MAAALAEAGKQVVCCSSKFGYCICNNGELSSDGRLGVWKQTGNLK